MNILRYWRKGTLILAFLAIILCFPYSVSAEESTSYKLYHEATNYAERGPAASENYKTNEDGVTWTSYPLTGTSFQIVTAPPAQAAEEPPPAGEEEEEEEEEERGGHRGSGTPYTRPAEKEQKPAAPKEPYKEIEFLPDGVTPPPIEEVPYPRLEKRLPYPPHYFAVVDDESSCPQCTPCSYAEFKGSALAADASGFHFPYILLGIAAFLGGFYLRFGKKKVYLKMGYPFMRFSKMLKNNSHNGRHGLTIFFPLFFVEERKNGKKKKNIRRRKCAKDIKFEMDRRRILLEWVIFLVLAAIFFFYSNQAQAASTAPQKLVYNGHLLDSSGNAVTSEVNVRFSFWESSDYVSGDITATGAIYTGAGNYADWQEEFTLTPNSDGYFTVDLGTGSALPDFSTLSAATITNLHLQVEVKASSAADTSYELLDKDTSNDSVDRAPLLSVPFALNADLLDGRDTGTASGSIPVLQTGGLLPLSTIPGGTNQDAFILDSDDSVVTGNIGLQFGTGLAEVLSYDRTNTWFNFSDSVRIQGNLTVTGAITVGDYDQGSGTGAGTIRWTGSSFEGFDGSNWKNLTAGETFVGVTTTTMSGSFSTGSLVGYQAASSYCDDEFAGSHMCQVSEIIETIEQSVTAFSGSSNAWVSEGAPGYTSDSNDCQGWSSGSGAHLGAWWEFSTDGGATVASGGGQGYLTNCAVVQPIACCR